MDRLSHLGSEKLADCHNKIPVRITGILLCISNYLFDCNFSTTDRLTAEETHATCLELHDAIFHSMNGEVAAKHGAVAGAFGHTDLANDNLTGLNFLTTKQLNSKALAWTIVNVFGCTACFDV
jgi:hypothetical protein